MAGRARTLALFMLMFALFAVIGYLLGGYFIEGNWLLGTSIFLVLAGLMNAFAYFFSDKIVLRCYRVKTVSEAEQPKLHKIVSNIALKANLPKPKVGIMKTDTPNAFATGRNPKRAVVACTTGMLDMLSDEELEGVVAHEMAHIKDRDILVMSVAATIAGAIAIIARTVWFSMFFGRGRREVNPLILLAAAITAPIAAILIQLAISRGREYKADYVGAKTIMKPWALANALEKLEAGNRKRPLQYGNPASSSLFIVNPFRGSGFSAIFSTHPPIKERIRRLREMVF
ncbi:MAG: M48 family metalloprotease [Candidatus Thermoplasmatota archaeon]|nr:M48 family metalloprotease [Candidatus Thermoplasmatota archaeon]